MNFQDDELWAKVKNMVKDATSELNIVLAIDMYYELGGKHVFVYDVEDSGLEQVYRIEGNKVIVIDSKNVAHLRDYDYVVYKARKVVRYNENSTIKKVLLDSECKEENIEEAKVYVEDRGEV